MSLGKTDEIPRDPYYAVACCVDDPASVEPSRPSSRSRHRPRSSIADSPLADLMANPAIGVHNAICKTCRVLMARGILGAFETWKGGIPYPCMTGDNASTAGPVHEPDHSVAISLGGDPSIRMLFPALRSRRQRARMMGQVGESNR